MVEVELYDDTSPQSNGANCLLATFGAAPSNASYDARFYSTLSNGLHRYEVYFEVPGSGTIQNLAFADFTDQLTTEEAAGEAHPVVTSSTTPSCPVLGQTNFGEWNVDGQAASQTTFASNMQLYYNGAWVNWTSTTAHPTFGYIWPPNGADINGWGDSMNPYQIQAISNWAAGDYTEWESGGPH